MDTPLPITDPTNLLLGAVLVLGFVLYLFVGSIVVPGPIRPGAPLADGTRIPYKLNGLALFLITIGIVGIGTFAGFVDLAILHRHFWALFVAANVLSIAMTAALYFGGRNREDAVREGLIKDLWYGVELNPTWLRSVGGGVDVKMFSYRPSLIGLALLNMSFAYVQWNRHGELSQAMLLYQAFTLVYVFNYFQFEYGMIYTWDIVQERFGFMLVWGDYAFVPFLYSITGWFLIDRTEALPIWALVLLPLMFVVGLWIFRGSNQQKDEFKRDPATKIWGKPAETIGGKILVSGFWGIGRKLNYTGEITVYWSFTLLAGDASFWPYVLPTWLICLLVHRAWRDDKRCRDKYGSLWEAYCKRATFKMIPFVY
ncbi:MAG: ERG4/ERG24 family protein [Myxococcota bacterium]|nr:ERG4/ERG24 family protein [Myxococcota bacterium]